MLLWGIQIRILFGNCQRRYKDTAKQWAKENELHCQQLSGTFCRGWFWGREMKGLEIRQAGRHIAHGLSSLGMVRLLFWSPLTHCHRNKTSPTPLKQTPDLNLVCFQQKQTRPHKNKISRRLFPTQHTGVFSLSKTAVLLHFWVPDWNFQILEKLKLVHYILPLKMLLKLVKCLKHKKAYKKQVYPFGEGLFWGHTWLCKRITPGSALSIIPGRVWGTI